MNIYSTVDNPTKEHGTKSLWILLHAQNDKRREEATPSEISRNSPKIIEQFSEIPSYFSELNTSIPTSFN